jgi:hypothetical protein
MNGWMNKGATLLAILAIAVLSSCERRVQMQPRADMPQTWEFKGILESGPTSGPEILALTVSPVSQQGRIYLFCRLRNISNQAVRMDDAYAPWNTLGMLTAIAFDSHGRQLRTNMGLGGIFTEGNYDDIAPGEELTGSIDLRVFLNDDEWPWTDDVTLRWLYRPRLADGNIRLRVMTGDTVLPQSLR